jgi:hypothetical protein
MPNVEDRHGEEVCPLKRIENGTFQSQTKPNSINGSPMKLSGDAELIDRRHRRGEVPSEHHSALP